MRSHRRTEQNLGRLETLHGAGIPAAEVPMLRELFETQFQPLLTIEGSKRTGKES